MPVVVLVIKAEVIMKEVQLQGEKISMRDNLINIFQLSAIEKILQSKNLGKWFLIMKKDSYMLVKINVYQKLREIFSKILKITDEVVGIKVTRRINAPTLDKWHEGSIMLRLN